MLGPQAGLELCPRCLVQRKRKVELVVVTEPGDAERAAGVGANDADEVRA